MQIQFEKMQQMFFLNCCFYCCILQLGKVAEPKKDSGPKKVEILTLNVQFRAEKGPESGST